MPEVVNTVSRGSQESTIRRPDRSMVSAGRFNDTKHSNEDVCVLNAPKLALRRITFNSEDGTPLTADVSWRFNLASPIYNVVYIDWSLIDNINNPCLLRIDEIPSNGITSKGQGYFTSLVGGTTNNILLSPQPAVKFNPISISQLTFTFVPGASRFKQTEAWSVELYFYTEDTSC